MNRARFFRGRRRVPWFGCGIALAGLLLAAAALAEQSEVTLKNGAKLRGEVTQTESEVVIQTEWGEVRLPRGMVESISPAEDGATTQPAEPEEPLVEDAPLDVPAPALMGPRDIQRLRLNEIALDGPAENVRVQFVNRAAQVDVVKEVLRELTNSPNQNVEAIEVLNKGKPHEKLQTILNTTGMKYADRIIVETDPAVFQVFRRRVLPLVQRGCARSGCHGGHSAAVFRFPAGSRDNEAVSYTTFAMLDELQTEFGPLLNRVEPEASALLGFMLPEADNPRGHPPVPKGKRLTPVLRSTRDANYGVVLDWINSLRVPHPEYELDWQLSGAATTLPATAPAPATTQPDTP